MTVSKWSISHCKRIAMGISHSLLIPAQKRDHAQRNMTFKWIGVEIYFNFPLKPFQRERINLTRIHIRFENADNFSYFRLSACDHSFYSGKSQIDGRKSARQLVCLWITRCDWSPGLPLERELRNTVRVYNKML